MTDKVMIVIALVCFLSGAVAYWKSGDANQTAMDPGPVVWWFALGAVWSGCGVALVAAVATP